MNLQGGNRASSSSTRGCTVITPPGRVPLLPRGHCEAEFYPVIAKRVPLLSLQGAQPRGNLHQGDRHALHPTWRRARDDREGGQCEARPPFRHCEARRAEAISWTKEI